MSSSKYFSVKTEYGPVRGIKTTSVLGRDFFDFRCIPFMKAPLGKLRFRDAQPPASWTEPLDVTGERPSYCTSELEWIKTDNPRPSFEGTEDAGIITVATPYLDRNLPVVVCKKFEKFYKNIWFNCQSANRHPRGRFSIRLWQVRHVQR